MTTPKASRKSSNQKFKAGDRVIVADHYPWIQCGSDDSCVIHMVGHGEVATVVGSYTDQFPSWGGAHGRKIYTLEFEDHGKISWYDEKYLTKFDDRPEPKEWR
jgi:hypothetical protein